MYIVHDASTVIGLNTRPRGFAAANRSFHENEKKKKKTTNS
jgi:hypothetical protein